MKTVINRILVINIFAIVVTILILGVASIYFFVILRTNDVLITTSNTPTPSKPTTRVKSEQAEAPINTSSQPVKTTQLAKVTPDYVIPRAVNGMAPVIYQIPTTLPVVYLGIDDGGTKTQAEIDLLAHNHIKATLFLSDLFIASNPDFFKPIIQQGSVVENHTLHHDIHLKDQSYDYQKHEICAMADHIEQYYGRRPTLFRPPGGAYSDSMRKAAYDCGMKAVVTWIAKVNGGSLQYQIGNHLRPGDIVLMHFRPEFKQDLEAFLTAIKSTGFHTELLEDLAGAE